MIFIDRNNFDQTRATVQKRPCTDESRAVGSASGDTGTFGRIQKFPTSVDPLESSRNTRPQPVVRYPSNARAAFASDEYHSA